MLFLVIHIVVWRNVCIMKCQKNTLIFMMMAKVIVTVFHGLFDRKAYHGMVRYLFAQVVKYVLFMGVWS